MAVDQLDVCSKALLKIGANSISSFHDGTAEAQIASSIYPVVRDALLAAHPWNFATAQRRLNMLSSPPIAGFANAFQIPEDCIRVLSAGSGGRARGVVYRLQNGTVCTDAQDIVLTYTYRAHESSFPIFFEFALIARLSAEFCIPLTDSTSRWKSLYQIAENELRRAKLADAQEDTPPRLEDFNLIEVRH